MSDGGNIASTLSIVMPRESGASSTPQPLDSHYRFGVLDRPVKPGDDSGVVPRSMTAADSA
jgi:hypothetical protein